MRARVHSLSSKRVPPLQVPLDVNITVFFNEQMLTASVQTVLTITDYYGNVYPASFAWDASGSTITVKPLSNLLDDRIYTVLITNGAQDLSSNNMLLDYSFSFTVVDYTRPNLIVSGSIPVPNFDNVPLTQTIHATFDEVGCAFGVQQ